MTCTDFQSMRRLIVFMPLGLLLLLTSGCQPAASSSPEIVIGHFASMTGSEATFGQSTDNGIKLAVDEINAAGGINGKQIRLITYDDKGDAREAGTAVTRLTTKDGVVAVLGEVASGLSLAGAPVCQESGVPMVTPSSTNPKVTKIGDMIFESALSIRFKVRCVQSLQASMRDSRLAKLRFSRIRHRRILSDSKKNFKRPSKTGWKSGHQADLPSW